MGYSDPSPPSITPTLGAEKLLNPGFETAGGGGADVFANWAEAAGDGAIADEVVDVHGGSHAAKLTAGPTSNTLIEQAPSLVAGKAYALGFWGHGDGTNFGSCTAQATTSPYPVVVNLFADAGLTYQQASRRFIFPSGQTGIWLDLRDTAVSGGIAYFDDMTLKELVLASMLGSVQDMGGESVTQEVKLAIPANLAAGLAFGIDSEAAPQNLVRVIYDRRTAKVHIWELVAGVWTELQATTTAYVANAVLKAQKLNNQITVWYNGALVGSADVPCTANPYTKFSLMATDVSVTFADYTIAGGVYNVAILEPASAADSHEAVMAARPAEGSLVDLATLDGVVSDEAVLE